MNEAGTGAPQIPDPTAVMPEDPRIRTIERIISALLRTGVALSLLLILAGTLIGFSWPQQSGYGKSAADVERLIGKDGAFPASPGWIARGVRELNGTTLIVLGLFVLIATPVMRVAVSIVVFAVQRDRTFAVITSIVLALLLLSFVLGKAAG